MNAPAKSASCWKPGRGPDRAETPACEIRLRPEPTIVALLETCHKMSLAREACGSILSETTRLALRRFPRTTDRCLDLKFHYLDSALHRMGGHPFNMAAAFRRELLQRGLEVEMHINARADAEIVRRLGARGTFAYRPRDHVSQDPLTRPLDNLLIKGNRMARELQAMEKNGIGPEDVVFLPLAYETELFACARWLADLPRAQHPRLCCYVMNDNIPVNPRPAQPTLTAVLYRFAANHLRASASAGRVLLSAPLEASAKKLRALTQLPVRVWPLPQRDPMEFAESSVAPVLEGEPVIVAIMGNSAPYKGFHFLPEILPQMQAAGRQVRSFIQILPLNATGRPTLDAALAQAMTPEMLPRWMDFQRSDFFRSHLDVHAGEMDDVEYFRHMRKAHIHLTAYNPAHYLNKVSGIFVEAAKAGRVNVASAQTWMGEQIRLGNAAGTTFDRWTPESIGAALRRAIDDIDALSKSAIQLAPAWRSRYSVATFLDGLLAWSAETGSV